MLLEVRYVDETSWTVCFPESLQGGRCRIAPVVLGLFVPMAGGGQTSGVNQGGPDYIHAPAGLDPMPQHGTPEAAAKVEQMRKAERHQRAMTDAAKLLQLGDELKAELDQMPADQFSLTVMRKAAEIEKLAHNVKEGMKY